MTLYFFPVLKKTETQVYNTAISTKELKLDPDYFAVYVLILWQIITHIICSIDQFVQKTQAYNFILIFDCRGKPFCKDGYLDVEQMPYNHLTFVYIPVKT